MGWMIVPTAWLTCGCESKNTSDLLRHAGSGKTNDRGARRLHPDIGADALRAVDGIVEHALAQANHREDHGDLEADGEGAERGAQLAVFEVFENEAVDQDAVGPSAQTLIISRRSGLFGQE